MKLAIFGSGNAGSATIMNLARNHNNFDQILLADRERGAPEAALGDALSAYPEFLAKAKVVDSLDGTYPDIIAVSAGCQIPYGRKPQDVLQENVEVVRKYVRDVKPNTIVVLVATPVDDVTAAAATFLGLPKCQVMGFGGDMDVSRLSAVLAMREISSRIIHVVGEHGSRAIPVYAGESSFGDVAHEVGGGFLRICPFWRGHPGI